MKPLLITLGFVLLFVLSPIWMGYVLQVMWGWFMVPAFHLPHISIALAYGLALLVRMFTYAGSESSNKEDKSFTKILSTSLAYSFLSPLFALGFGYVAHLFM